MGEHERVALISGASRGLGAATAREMARHRYHVVVNYLRSADRAAEVVSAIEEAGGTAEAVRADVCDRDQVVEMVAGIEAAHGRIDALVSNANTVNPAFEPLLSLSWESFSAKVTGELAAAFFLTQSVLPIMQKQRAGRIVYISSTAPETIGVVPDLATAKAALNTFSRHVAGAAAEYGVTANAIAFPLLLTDASAGVLTTELGPFLRSRSVNGELLTPEDAARTVALVADGALGAVGQILRTDAGFDVLDQQRQPLVAHFT